MSSVQALLKYIFGGQPAEGKLEDPLDYEQVVHLDAEDLAEQGIQSAYAALLPQLLRYTTAPLEVTEELDSDAGAYAVCAGGSRYDIWASAIDPNDGWARATAAFFTIVNASLVESEHKFYALYGGNDLSGLFLTTEEFRLACGAIKQRHTGLTFRLWRHRTMAHPCVNKMVNRRTPKHSAPSAVRRFLLTATGGNRQ